ncbi:MAG TPA: hypothetical protein VJ249_09315 [Candidatus Bathyarchaeia archaeon]|nr:hypothetical protein [Candidatus Bathyarchaeia archaeon]
MVVFVVYRTSMDGRWHCSWCYFTHEDYRVVIDHENNEHGGKKVLK